MIRLRPPEDPQVEAATIIADAIDRAIERFGPAADAVTHLSEAQKKLCAFLVGHRLKLAAAVPAVLIAAGAISPNAAKGLHDVTVALLAHM